MIALTPARRPEDGPRWARDLQACLTHRRRRPPTRLVAGAVAAVGLVAVGRRGARRLQRRPARRRPRRGRTPTHGRGDGRRANRSGRRARHLARAGRGGGPRGPRRLRRCCGRDVRGGTGAAAQRRPGAAGRRRAPEPVGPGRAAEQHHVGLLPGDRGRANPENAAAYGGYPVASPPGSAAIPWP